MALVVVFTSEDRVRDVIRNFNADGFSSLYPKYKRGRPPKFTLGQRRGSRRSPDPSRPGMTCLGACRMGAKVLRASWQPTRSPVARVPVYKTAALPTELHQRETR